MKRLSFVFLVILLSGMVFSQSPHCQNSVNEPKWLCNQHIRSVVFGYGFYVEEDKFNAVTPHGTKTFTNLIATHNPHAPRRLVMACHYDSKYETRFKFYGATDSALPCALLLDLAATLSQYLNCPNTGTETCQSNPFKDDISLQLLFFDGEEAFVRWSETDSLYGSKHLARVWGTPSYSTTLLNGSVVYKKHLDRMDVMVLLDLLGYKNTQMCNFQNYGFGQNFAADVYAELPIIESKLRNLGCLRNIGQIFYANHCPGGIEDDHVPFMEKNVRIVHLIPPRFPPVWHNEGDKEENLDDQTIENLASILRVFVAQYLNLDVSSSGQNGRHNTM